MVYAYKEIYKWGMEICLKSNLAKSKLDQILTIVLDQVNVYGKSPDEIKKLLIKNYDKDIAEAFNGLVIKVWYDKNKPGQLPLPK